MREALSWHKTTSGKGFFLVWKIEDASFVQSKKGKNVSPPRRIGKKDKIRGENFLKRGVGHQT